MAVDLELRELPHFGSESEPDAEVASAVGHYYGRLVAAFQKSRLDEATRRRLLRSAKRALLCPACGPGNVDPARLIQGYALVHLVGCEACVKRYTRTALAQGFTHDQLEAVLTLVSGLQATATLLHARAAEREQARGRASGQTGRGRFARRAAAKPALGRPDRSRR